MNGIDKKAVGVVLIVVLGVLLLLSVVKNVSLARKVKQIKAENSQLTLTLKERDNKLEADRGLYTNLAGRLHKEMKKSAELEQQLNDLKRK